MHDPSESGVAPESDRAASEESPEDVVGPYRLLQRLGEGGFGTVWMARQDEPIRRIVAVKILKPGMDTRQVVARFESERQALALMDHPNIAKVLDAGSTVRGRPYFVMELVKGVPISKYCDEAQLSMRERLELFRAVCGAVQHAHQKGIIHRDLKPSNVLVTTLDGVAVPKVIDFGIAKVLAAPLTERTMFTELGQMMGTPEYMAPEQAEASGLDVDTRADIYSLGVVLYELLTGTKPFELREVLEHGHSEVLRAIREVDPPKPSTRISTLGERATPIARQRRALPRELGRSLRGDLDWVVMKAIEKERSRRYETAAALSDDVGRFLEDRPVLASPPSTAHRMRKYVRRHRVGVAAVGAIALLLVAGLIATASGYVEASAQRDKAQVAGEKAQREGARAKQVVDILNEMLSGADPYAGKEKDYTLRSLLDDFDARLDASLSADPEVEATVRGIIGRAYRGLGDSEKAEKHLALALALRKHAEGPESVMALGALADWIYVPYEKGDYAVAEAQAREGLAAARRVAPDSVLVASYLYLLGIVLQAERGSGPGSEETEAVLREAVALREKVLGPNHAETSDAVFSLARTLSDGGPEKKAEAEALFHKRVDTLLKTKSPDHPNLAMTLDNLAHLASDRGDQVEAEKLLREAIELQRRRLGNEHPDLATTLCTLGDVERKMGKLDEADARLSEAVAIYRKSLEADHPDLAVAIENLALVKRDRGNLEDAEQLLNEACSMMRKRRDPDHPDYLTTIDMLALVRRMRGNLAGAEQLYRELSAAQLRNHPPESSQAVASAASLAVVLTEISYAKKTPEPAQEAESILRGVLEIRRRTLAATDPRLGVVESHLADALAAQGASLEEARALAVQAWSRVSNPETLPATVRSRQRREILERVVRVHDVSERLTPGSIDAATMTQWKETLQALRDAEKSGSKPAR